MQIQLELGRCVTEVIKLLLTTTCKIKEKMSIHPDINRAMGLGFFHVGMYSKYIFIK